MAVVDQRELQTLVEKDLEDVAISRPRTKLGAKRVAAWLLFGALAVVALRFAITSRPCSEDAGAEGEGASVVSLAATLRAEDVVGLVEAGDHGALGEWLQTQSEIGEAVEKAGPSPEAKEKLLKQMSGVKSPEEAKRVVARVMRRSVSKWQTKRQDLKRYLKKRPRRFRRKEGEEQIPKDEVYTKERRQSEVAECVFDVLQATSAVASLAANINDAAKTCAGRPSANSTAGQACTFNVGSVMFAITWIATMLSKAASTCADTITTGPTGSAGALCSAGVAGVTVSLAQLSSSSGLLALACDKGAIVGGFTPSDGFTTSHLGDPTNPARRLDLAGLGGGHGSTQTRCAVDVTSAAWFLAQAGLAINKAAAPGPETGDGKTGDYASCKIKGDLSGTTKQTQQRLCTMDVAGAIFAFSEMATFLQLALSHCSDELHVDAMCGAGITGTIGGVGCATTSLAGAVAACSEVSEQARGGGRHGAEAPGAVLGAVLGAGGRNEAKAQGAARGAGGRHGAQAQAKAQEDPNLRRRRSRRGRKLSIDDETEARLDALKARFASPEEVWKSIGYDLNDKDADYRSSLRMHSPVEEVASLMEEPEAKSSGLFGLQQSCS